MNWATIAHRALLSASSLGTCAYSGEPSKVRGDPPGERLQRKCPRRVRVRPGAMFVAPAGVSVGAKSRYWKMVGSVGWLFVCEGDLSAFRWMTRVG